MPGSEDSIRAVGGDGKESLASESVGATPSATLDAGAPELPTTFALAAPRPNPAQGFCDIGFDLPQASHVKLEVFDVRGRSVARVVDATLPAGRHSARWQAERYPAGLYFVRFTADAYRANSKIIVTR